MLQYHIASGTASLLCREWGEGDPLVLLHGNGENSLYFEKQFDLFSRYFRVIAVDSRGHGGSTHGEEGLSIALMAEDVLAVLDALGIERAHLLGFSDGGNIALSFALRWPERVGKLILNGANIRMRAGVVPWATVPVHLSWGALGMLSRFNRRAAQKRDVLGLMVNDYGVTFEDLGWIKAETLVIVGERDLIRTEETDRITAALPNVQRVTIPGADHFCAAKAPHRFNLAVLKFLLAKKETIPEEKPLEKMVVSELEKLMETLELSETEEEGMKEYKLVYLNKGFKASREKDLEQSQNAINEQIEQGWNLQQIVSPNDMVGALVGVFYREKEE